MLQFHKERPVAGLDRTSERALRRFPKDQGPSAAESGVNTKSGGDQSRDTSAPPLSCSLTTAGTLSPAHTSPLLLT